MPRIPWAAVVVAVLSSGCGLATQGSTSGSVVQVVAAENMWGSIASQIGGTHAHVVSIVANPATDPHDYEPTPGDARLIAEANYVIANGAGYDPWTAKLLAANPVSGRVVLTVADLLGKHEGDNPHFWYSPVYVGEVVDRIARDLSNLDPGDSAYFRQQAAQYKTVGLGAYHHLITVISSKYAGRKVAATESIFAYLADSLHLDLITPPSFLNAISEGTDPTVADKATVQHQIAARQITVLVFNVQNSTPDVQSLVDMAQAEGIPIVSITETLVPPTATFQAWQTAQLDALLRALGG